LRRLEPDVVHVQAHFGVGRTVLKTAASQGLSTVVTNHFMPENLIGYGPIPRSLHGPLIRWAWRDLTRVYRDAQCVTTPTPRGAELLHSRGLAVPISAISCGIDLDTYRQRPADPAVGPITVLFVGRLDKEKHVDELLRAVAAAPVGAGIRADIVGAGTCGADLRALAGSLGIADRVRFRGFLSDDELAATRASCQVFCMPGTAELQSLATMEAMAAGLPILAANAMALPHLVHHGLNGYLYTPGDHADLTARLTQLADQPQLRATMGAASNRLIAAHDINHTLDAFEGLYRQAHQQIPQTKAMVHPASRGRPHPTPAGPFQSRPACCIPAGARTFS